MTVLTIVLSILVIGAISITVSVKNHNARADAEWAEIRKEW
mgnify:CR=1 FL=1